jgi:hypothetical protein
LLYCLPTDIVADGCTVFCLADKYGEEKFESEPKINEIMIFTGQILIMHNVTNIKSGIGCLFTE